MMATELVDELTKKIHVNGDFNVLCLSVDGKIGPVEFINEFGKDVLIVTPPRR